MATGTTTTAAYVNDHQINVTYTVSGSAAFRLYLRRKDKAGTVVGIGMLPTNSGTSTYSDTTTQPNNSYSYQVGWQNVGDLVYTWPIAWSTPVYTSPLPPTNCRVSRNSTNVTVSWDNPDAAVPTGWQVWRANNGAWEGSALASVTPASTLTYTASGTDTTATHQFRVRGYISSTYSAYAISPVLPACAPPNAPTLSATSQTPTPHLYNMNKNIIL